jgi:hypothetical protein
MSTESTPRRHTLTDAYNDALATIERLTTRNASTTATAELTRNAKGDTQVAVKATGATIVEAEQAAIAAYDRLCSRYPHGANGAS